MFAKRAIGMPGIPENKPPESKPVPTKVNSVVEETLIDYGLKHSGNTSDEDDATNRFGPGGSRSDGPGVDGSNASMMPRGGERDCYESDPSRDQNPKSTPKIGKQLGTGQRIRCVGLTKRHEDTAIRPLDDKLELMECDRHERREKQYLEQHAKSKQTIMDAVKDLPHEEAMEKMASLVAGLTSEISYWRSYDDRRIAVRKWLMEHRFFGDGSIDQRRLHHDDGHCPLHDAAADGDCEILPLLLQQGANVNLLNKFDMTPLDLAEWYRRSHLALNTPQGSVNARRFGRVVDILKAHGARNNVNIESVKILDEESLCGTPGRSSRDRAPGGDPINGMESDWEAVSIDSSMLKPLTQNRVSAGASGSNLTAANMANLPSANPAFNQGAHPGGPRPQDLMSESTDIGSTTTDATRLTRYYTGKSQYK